MRAEQTASMPRSSKPLEQLRQENEELRARLAEAEETLRAIHEGEVDAVIVNGENGEQVYSLVGAESIYRLIVETMKEAAFTVSFDGKVLFCNAQFGEFVRRPLEKIIGHGLCDFVASEDLDAAQKLLEVGRAEAVRQRLVFAGDDGSRVPAHISSNVLSQPDGLSICVVATDLRELEQSTEMLQQLRQQRSALERANQTLAIAHNELCAQNERLQTADAALRQTADELRRSNDDLQQFAYVASHDLQEPLRVINGFLKLLEAKYGPRLDDDARKYIDYSVNAADRMSGLIRDLLAYSRLDRQGRREESVDAGEALAAALANLSPAIADASAVVSSDELPTVRGNRTHLTLLFQNLVGNGIKFRHPARPCEIHIGAARSANQWTFSIRDNGIGIAADQCQRIFEIFQRLHKREEYPGTGIGLAVCKRIVERQGGRIWVESQPDQGSVFYFTAPGES